MTILTKPVEAWTWHTGGPMLTRPLPAGQFAVFGSTDGRVYVVEARRRNSALPGTDGGTDRRGAWDLRDPHSS